MCAAEGPADGVGDTGEVAYHRGEIGKRHALVAVGARMVIPVGETQSEQVLQVLEKRPDGTIETRDVVPVRFVPLHREPGA